MDHNEFRKYAIKHNGMSSIYLDQYMSSSVYGLTPNVIEERQLNATALDVFSRLMMDRIIFMGTAIDDYVANVITAQLLFLQSSLSQFSSQKPCHCLIGLD